MGYEAPRTVMLETLSVKVPGVLGLGAGFTSVTLPLTAESAGITTFPAAFLTSSTTCAVNGSPTLAVRDEIVSVAAMSIWVPTPSRALAGGGGGLVRLVGLRCAGGRVTGGSVVFWFRSGTSPIGADDSEGCNARF